MNAPEHSASGEAPDVHELDHHLGDYKKIIVTLAVLTAVEFGISYLMGVKTLPMTPGVIVLVAMAFFKAILVAKFFMHLRYDPKPLAMIAVTPLVLASIIPVIAVFDACKGPNI